MPGKMDKTDSSVGGCKQFECRVIGYPKPWIKWLKDGEEITNNMRYQFDYSIDGIVTLIIEDVTYQDQGCYQCYAENSEGWATTSSVLCVHRTQGYREDELQSTHAMTITLEDNFEPRRQEPITCQEIIESDKVEKRIKIKRQNIENGFEDDDGDDDDDDFYEKSDKQSYDDGLVVSDFYRHGDISQQNVEATITEQNSKGTEVEMSSISAFDEVNEIKIKTEGETSQRAKMKFTADGYVKTREYSQAGDNGSATMTTQSETPVNGIYEPQIMTTTGIDKEEVDELVDLVTIKDPGSRKETYDSGIDESRYSSLSSEQEAHAPRDVTIEALEKESSFEMMAEISSKFDANEYDNNNQEGLMSAYDAEASKEQTAAKAEAILEVVTHNMKVETCDKEQSPEVSFAVDIEKNDNKNENFDITADQPEMRVKAGQVPDKDLVELTAEELKAIAEKQVEPTDGCDILTRAYRKESLVNESVLTQKQEDVLSNIDLTTELMDTKQHDQILAEASSDVNEQRKDEYILSREVDVSFTEEELPDQEKLDAFEIDFHVDFNKPGNIKMESWVEEINVNGMRDEGVEMMADITAEDELQMNEKEIMSETEKRMNLTMVEAMEKHQGSKPLSEVEFVKLKTKAVESHDNLSVSGRGKLPLQTEELSRFERSTHIEKLMDVSDKLDIIIDTEVDQAASSEVDSTIKTKSDVDKKIDETFVDREGQGNVSEELDVIADTEFDQALSSEIDGKLKSKSDIDKKTDETFVKEEGENDVSEKFDFIADKKLNLALSSEIADRLKSKSDIDKKPDKIFTREGEIDVFEKLDFIADTELDQALSCEIADRLKTKSHIDKKTDETFARGDGESGVSEKLDFIADTEFDQALFNIDKKPDDTFVKQEGENDVSEKLDFIGDKKLNLVLSSEIADRLKSKSDIDKKTDKIFTRGEDEIDAFVRLDFIVDTELDQSLSCEISDKLKSKYDINRKPDDTFVKREGENDVSDKLDFTADTGFDQALSSEIADRLKPKSHIDKKTDVTFERGDGESGVSEKLDFIADSDLDQALYSEIDDKHKSKSDNDKKPDETFFRVDGESDVSKKLDAQHKSIDIEPDGVCMKEDKTYISEGFEISDNDIDQVFPSDLDELKFKSDIESKENSLVNVDSSDNFEMFTDTEIDEALHCNLDKFSLDEEKEADITEKFDVIQHDDATLREIDKKFQTKFDVDTDVSSDIGDILKGVESDVDKKEMEIFMSGNTSVIKSENLNLIADIDFEQTEKEGKMMHEIGMNVDTSFVNGADETDISEKLDVTSDKEMKQEILSEAERKMKNNTEKKLIGSLSKELDKTMLPLTDINVDKTTQSETEAKLNWTDLETKRNESFAKENYEFDVSGKLDIISDTDIDNAMMIETEDKHKTDLDTKQNQSFVKEATTDMSEGVDIIPMADTDKINAERVERELKSDLESQEVSFAKMKGADIEENLDAIVQVEIAQLQSSNVDEKLQNDIDRRQTESFVRSGIESETTSTEKLDIIDEMDTEQVLSKEAGDKCKIDSVTKQEESFVQSKKESEISEQFDIMTDIEIDQASTCEIKDIEEINTPKWNEGLVIDMKDTDIFENVDLISDVNTEIIEPDHSEADVNYVTDIDESREKSFVKVNDREDISAKLDMIVDAESGDIMPTDIIAEEKILDVNLKQESHVSGLNETQSEVIDLIGKIKIERLVPQEVKAIDKMAEITAKIIPEVGKDNMTDQIQLTLGSESEQTVETDAYSSGQEKLLSGMEAEVSDLVAEEEDLTPRLAPHVIGTRSELVVDETQENIRVSWDITGHPEPKLEFFKNTDKNKNNEVLEAGGNILVTCKGNRWTLERKKPVFGDGGNYTCRATNSEGTAQAHINVALRAELAEEKRKAKNDKKKFTNYLESLRRGSSSNLPPHFVFKPQDITVVEGEPINAKCSVMGHPRPELKWFKDGQKLKKTKQMNIYGCKHGCHHMEIENSIRTLTGDYRVLGENEEGDVEGFFHITVEVPAKINEAPETLTIEKGNSVKIICHVEGFPAPSVEWACDGVPIKADKCYKVEITEDTVTLAIPEAELTDTATYTLTLENIIAINQLMEVDEEEVDEKEINSHVKLKKMVETAGRFCTDNRSINLKITEPPHIKTCPKHVTLLKGEPLLITCDIDGTPAPEVSWKFNKIDLTTGDNHVMESSPIVASLSIPQTILSDTGTYTLTLDNGVGTDAVTVDVIINEIPKIVMCPKSIAVEKGETIDIACEFIGTPPPKVMWYHLGVLILDDKHYQVELTEQGTTLKIPDSVVADGGVFTLTLENCTGKDSITIFVSVHDPDVPVESQEKGFSPTIDLQLAESEDMFLKGYSVMSGYKDDINEVTLEEGEIIELLDTALQYYWLIRKREVKDQVCYAPATVLQMEDHKATEMLKKDQGVKKPRGKFPGKRMDDNTTNREEVHLREVFPVYSVVADYAPPEGEIHLDEGANVEVLDQHRADSWLIRTMPGKHKAVQEGWVPASYFKAKSEGGQTLERSTQEKFREDIIQITNKQQEAQVKRRYALTDMIESERDYIRDLKLTVDKVLKKMNDREIPVMLKKKKDVIFSTLEEICNFHNEVFISNLMNCTGSPKSVGSAFLSSRDQFMLYVPFWQSRESCDMILHSPDGVQASKDLSQVLDLIEPLAHQLNKPVQRLNNYIELLKDFLRYTARIGEDCTEIQEAIEMLTGICRQVQQLSLLSRVQGFNEDLSQMGPIMRNDRIIMWDNEQEEGKDRHIFLFTDKLLIAEYKTTETTPTSQALQFDQIVDIKNVQINADVPEDGWLFELWYAEPASGKLTFQAKNIYTKQAWVRDLREELRKLGVEKTDIMPERRTLSPAGPRLAKTMGKSPLEIGGSDVLGIPSTLDYGVIGTDRTKTDEYVTFDTDISSQYMVPEFEDGTTRPIFKKRLRKTAALEGTSTRMECIVSGIPQPHVLWMKNNIPLKESDNCCVVTDGDTHALVIDDVKTDDAAIYSARAMNVNGSVMTSAELIIGDELTDAYTTAPTEVSGMGTYYDIVSSSQFKTPAYMFKKDGGIDVQAGHMARFDCRVVAFPKPEIVWMKDGVVIEPNDRINLLNFNDEIYSVLVRSVTTSDGGRYTCWARNKFGEAMTESILNVIELKQEDEEGDLAPKFLTKFYDQRVCEGVPTELQCLIAGRPEPSISWLIGNMELLPSANIEVKRDDNLCTVQIKSPSKADSGDYSCKLSNPLGEATCTAKLIVDELKEIPKTMLPKFVRKIEDIKTNRGEELVFECVVLGEPKPKVTWLFDHKPISGSDHHYRMSEDGDRYILKVKDVQPEDAGKFTCKAVNVEGEVYCSADVRVTDRRKAKDMADQVPSSKEDELKHGQGPTFTRRIQDSYAPDDGIAKFECRVTGVPEPDVTWTKNGQVVTPGGRVWVSRDGGYSSLTISNISPEDVGSYTCAARNTLGQVTCSGQLNMGVPTKREPYIPSTKKFALDDEYLVPVKRPMYSSDAAPSMPYDKPTLLNVRDDTVRLSWLPAYAAGLPDEISPVTYTLESRERPNYEWQTVSSGIPSNSYLAKHLKPDRDYDFRVRAQNTYGFSEPTMPVIMERRMPDEIRHFDIPDTRAAPRFPPPRPIVTDLGESAVGLAWKPPYLPMKTSTPSLSYVLEAQELPGRDWLPLASRITDTSYHLSDLLPDRDYNIRLRSENEYGFSEPSEPIWLPRARSFPDVPISRPDITELEPDAVRLSWQRIGIPSYNMDEEPLLYMLEMQEPPYHTWRRVADDLTDTTYHVTGLESGTDYRFRISGRTPKGVVTEPSPAASLYRTIVQTRPPVDRLEVGDYEPQYESLQLRWSKVDIPPYQQSDEPLHYMVEVQEHPLQEWRALASGIPTTSYRVSDLARGQDYRFRVRGVTPYGLTPPSYELPVSYRQTEPAPIRPLAESLRIADLEADSLRLSWQPATADFHEPFHYRVEMQEFPQMDWRPLATGIQDTNYRVSGLTPSRDYSFRIVPETPSRVYEPTPPVTLTSLPVKPRIQINEPKVVDLGTDSVRLSWKPAELPFQPRQHVPIWYNVDVMEMPNTNWTTVGRRIQDATYVVKGLRPERDYKFRVRAETEYGSSDSTMPAALYRKPVPVFPKKEPIISGLNADSIVLSWQPADVAGGANILSGVTYRIEIQEPPGIGLWRPIVTGIPHSTYHVTGLSPDRDYLFRVRAEVDRIITEPTMPIYLSRRAGPPSIPVEQPYLFDIKPDSVKMQWRSVELPTRITDYSPVTYRIEVLEGPGHGWLNLARGIPHTDFHLTNLNPDKQYSFRVRAENDYGVSEPTQPVILVKRAAVPTIPQDAPLIYDVGAGSISMSWRPAQLPSILSDSTPVTYTVYVQEPPITTWRPVARRIPHTSYHFSNLRPDKEYNFRVEAENEYGASKPTSDAKLKRIVDYHKPIDLLEISDIDTDRASLKLKWKARNLPGTKKKPVKYHVERWQPSDWSWKPVVSDIPDTTYNVSGIHPSRDYLFRVRAETDSGLSEPSFPISYDRFRAGKKVPIRYPQLYDLEPESVRLSWQPSYIPRISTRSPLRYSLEMRNLGGRDWKPLASDIYDTSYRITGLKPSDDYEFRVRALTDEGPTEPSLPIPLHRRSVLPRMSLEPPEVDDLDETSARLKWNRVEVPTFDNSDQPLTYMIEAQQLPRYDWTPVARGISGTDYDLTGLRPYHDYHFRVRAELPTGLSEPTPYIPLYRRPTHYWQSLRVRPAVPISRPEIWEEEPCTAHLRWKRVHIPPFDQYRDLNYMIELQEAPSRDWRPIARNITSTEYKVPELGSRKDYLFRIRAQMPDGTLSEPTPPIQYYRSKLPMTRQPAKVYYEYKMPEQDFSVPTRSYIDHLTTYIPPRLPIEKPDMNELSPECVTLKWKPARVPESIKSSSHLTYTIEVRTPPGFEWRELVSGLKGLTYNLKNLHPRMDYMFRVRAWNEYGCSEPSLPANLYRPIQLEERDYDAILNEEIEKKWQKEFGQTVPPRLPMDTPRLESYSPESFKLSWLPARIPAYAKRAPITYLIELKEPPIPGWRKYSSGIDSTTFDIQGLKPMKDYSFRVRAQTQYGVSDPTLPAAIQRTKDFIHRPSLEMRDDDLSLPSPSYMDSITSGVPPRVPSGRPTLSDVQPNSVTLSWPAGRVPSYVKGAGMVYVIEVRQLPAHTWCIFMDDVKETSYHIPDLKPDQDYMFRIKAKNDFGISEPMLPVSLFRDKDDYVPPVHSRSVSRDRSASWTRGGSFDRMGGDDELGKYKVRGKVITPEFVTPDDEIQFGVLGRPAKIILKLQGLPLPTVQWHFKGGPLEDKYTATVSPEGVACLEIPKMSWDDVGDYKCCAENDHGIAVRIVRLDMADPPTFIEPLKDVVVFTRDCGKLECHVDGVPYPSIKFMKDWRPLAESARTKVWNESPDYWALTVDGAIMMDSGQYQCVAENIAGKAYCSAKMTVQDKVEPVGDMRFRDTNVDVHYHVLEEIGRGRHGIVRRVIEKATGREYAAKFIQVCDNPQKDFFRHELDTIKRIKHKNVISVHDAFETDRQLVLITELVTGGELLDKMIDDDKWNENEAAFYVRQLLDILLHFNDIGILHLDLKPSNIHLGQHDSEEIKLLDFGFARRFSPDHSTILNYGTPEFTSPEQINSEPLSPATDIWSLGVLTYILLSGVSPFHDVTDKEILTRILTCDWDFIKDAFENISPEAKDFISKLLVKEPYDRLSIEECLNHPWVKNSVKRGQGLKLPLDKVREFQSRDHWQRIVNRVKTVANLKCLSKLLRGSPAPIEEGVDGIVDTESEFYVGDAARNKLMKDKSLMSEMDRDEEFSAIDEEEKRLAATEEMKHKQRSRDIDFEEGIAPIFKDKIRDRAYEPGENVTFQCSVLSPSPAMVTWYRNEEILTDGNRIRITSSDDGFSTLTLLSAKPNDGGIYKCVARSKTGYTSCRARLLLGDVPERPGRPVVTMVSAEEAFLIWDAPISNGNSDIIAYKVDLRKSGDERWTTATYTIDECAMIWGLMPKTAYRFRVSCLNRFGSSPYSWASFETRTKSAGTPRLVIDKELDFTLSRSRRAEEQPSPTASRQGSVEPHDREPPLFQQGAPEEHYDIDELVLKGKFTEFKTCVNKTSKEPCVAKIVPYAPGKRDEVLREFNLLRTVSQYNIVRLFESFLIGDRVYIIYERLYGENVVRHISYKNKYTEETVAKVIRQVLDAVQYLHHIGIVHLNLQPNSIIMVSRRRLDLKLVDFSMARRLETPGGETVPVMGFPDFIAPEVACEEKATFASDLWTVGVVTFVLLSGVSPFASETEGKVLKKVALNSYSLYDLFENITREGLRFVFKLLKRKPSERTNVVDCLEDRWLQLTDDMVKSREKTVFLSGKLRAFANEYQEKHLSQDYKKIFPGVKVPGAEDEESHTEMGK